MSIKRLWPVALALLAATTALGLVWLTVCSPKAERGPRSHAHREVHSIALGLHIYALTYGGEFPKTLAAMNEKIVRFEQLPGRTRDLKWLERDYRYCVPPLLVADEPQEAWYSPMYLLAVRLDVSPRSPEDGEELYFVIVTTGDGPAFQVYEDKWPKSRVDSLTRAAGQPPLRAANARETVGAGGSEGPGLAQPPASQGENAD